MGWEVALAVLLFSFSINLFLVIYVARRQRLLDTTDNDPGLVVVKLLVATTSAEVLTTLPWAGRVAGGKWT